MIPLIRVLNNSDSSPFCLKKYRPLIGQGMGTGGFTEGQNVHTNTQIGQSLYWIRHKDRGFSQSNNAAYKNVQIMVSNILDSALK